MTQILGCTVIALSRTQQTLALSSGEAELYAIGASILESLQLRNIILEARLSKLARSQFTRSPPAKPMAARFGTTRRTRHIGLRFMYLQHLVKSGTIRITKKLVTKNTAYVLAKCAAAETLRRHIEKLGLVDEN